MEWEMPQSDELPDMDCDSGNREGASGGPSSSEVWAESEIRHLLGISTAHAAVPTDTASDNATSSSSSSDPSSTTASYQSSVPWDRASAKMGNRSCRRSPSICREKWRSLVRKLKANNNNNNPHHQLPQAQHSNPSSFSFFKDAEDSSLDPYHLHHEDLQFSPKGLEPNILNIQRSDGDRRSTTSVMSQKCTPQNGRNTWGWRESNSADMPQWNGGVGCYPVSVPHSAGHIIIVKWGGMIRKIGTDGSADAIKEAIRNAFGLRSKRPFWVEDDDGVVRSFDRAMPQTTYTLHIDPGVTIKLYHYDACISQAINSEDATLYSEDDFRELLARNGWQSLREVGTYKDVESIQDLRPMAAYHHSGVKDMNL
ncbi:trihelix transcription factor GT-1-like isoform X2 [Telopea speciosissima]|uniref:trihelix transcription factor GT-1-like isoform X2 n=1 Tax=Telopea speciosissima TaxID=54955 RepID=UPI001CC8277B|nr:trihelix transcription factor GT-1-like isoform X2 [Telopea speciosissima]